MKTESVVTILRGLTHRMEKAGRTRLTFKITSLDGRGGVIEGWVKKIGAPKTESMRVKFVATINQDVLFDIDAHVIFPPEYEAWMEWHR